MSGQGPGKETNNAEGNKIISDSRINHEDNKNRCVEREELDGYFSLNDQSRLHRGGHYQHGT